MKREFSLKRYYFFSLTLKCSELKKDRKRETEKPGYSGDPMKQEVETEKAEQV